MSVIDDLEADEGFSSMSYRCTQGYLTVGHGINLETTPMPKSISKLWLKLIVNDLLEVLEKHLWFRRLDQNRQDVILNMAYQLGIGGLFKFKKMIDALSHRDFERAADEMLDSKWAKQTPNRALRNAKKMRIGA